MPTNSEILDRTREDANLAFDHHCAQWDLLQANAAPTLEDLGVWLAARKLFWDAQEIFELEIRKHHQASLADQ
jgi:hypothetical protein